MESKDLLKKQVASTRASNTTSASNTSLNAKIDILKIQNECYLCGHELNTYVEAVPATRFVVERAQCHNCMTLVRVKNHTLQ